MACCEKCWGQAHLRSICTGKSQVDCYAEIIKEKELTNNICTPKEQAGMYWDKEYQCDTRYKMNK